MVESGEAKVARLDLEALTGLASAFPSEFVQLLLISAQVISHPTPPPDETMQRASKRNVAETVY